MHVFTLEPQWKSTIQKFPITQLEQLTQGGVICSINAVISLTRAQTEAAARARSAMVLE